MIEPSRCAQCGFPRRPGTRFCESCGESHERPHPSTSSVELSARRRGRRRLVVGATALAITLAVATGVFALRGVFSEESGGTDSLNARDPTAFNEQTSGVQRLVDAMKKDSPMSLYEALSSSTRAGLSKPEFVRAYEHQRRRTGAVTDVSVSGPFTSRGTAEGGVGRARMHIGYRGSAARAYQAYFLFEDGEWRFWFTGRSATR